MGTAWRLFFFALIGCLCQLIRTMHIKHSFRDVNHLAFRHLAIHRNSGQIFIGADNKLVKLSSHLQLLESSFTGPREDNPKCPPPLLPCDEQKYLMNSYSKGIAIDYENNVVISCSSLFHGFCEKRLLGNITVAQRYIFKPMVPNNHKSSSIILIAPGPSSSASPSPTLYIAATYANQGLEAYRNMVPAISARDLQTFEYSYRDSIGSSFKRINQSLKLDFLVRYIYGFSYQDFIYFITVQMESASSPKRVTKLVRLCQNDKYFNSYIEMALECRDSSMYYNVAVAAFLDSVQSGKLYVTFKESKNLTNQFSTNANSGVCVFKMEALRQMLDSAVKDCYNGVGKLGPAHIHLVMNCPSTSPPSSPEFCGKSKSSQQYPAILVEQSATESSILEETGPTLTAIVTDTVNDNQTVIFLGLADGGIKKMALAEDGNFTMIQEVSVDYGKAVVGDLYLSADQQHLYALTEDKVVMLDVADCHLKTTCDSCMSVRDLYCGWCVLTNKCTKKDKCMMSDIKPSWLPSTQGKCAKMANLKPPALSIEKLETDTQQVGQITFQVEELAVPSGGDMNVKCAFVDDQTLRITSAVVSGNSLVQCGIPPLTELPPVSLPMDHKDIELQLHIGGRTIVTRSLALYDCRVHDTCTACTSSSFSCQWCSATHACMNGTSAMCPMAGGNLIQSTAGITSVDNCAKLESPTSDIVVHSGEQKEVSAQLPNLQTFQDQDLKCHFSYLAESEVVRATYTGGRVYCDRVQFEYADSETPYVMASFKVTWGADQYPLDNPDNVQVRIYKCPLMVTNCGKCLTMDPEYECGWCENSCSLQKHCPGNWLDRDATCPHPQILRFNPATGPVGGKTNVSVTGINLGKTVADIQGGVKVAGVQCIVEQNNYEASSGFTCETVPTTSDNSGTISVLVTGKFTAESDSKFSFVDPMLQSVQPKKGPVAGGTTLTVLGSHMNTGSTVKVTIDGASCKVSRSNGTALECVTPASLKEGKANLTVNFGGAEKMLTKSFQFVTDPSITMIEPKSTILSGGTTLTILGKNLDVIDKPQFFVRLRDGKRKMVPCRKKNEFRIHCLVPGLRDQNYNVSITNPEEVHYGFIMDSVKNLEKFSENAQFGPLLYYPDPKVHIFPEENSVRKYVKDEKLTIMGRFLNMKELISDVVILVGTDVCTHPSGTEDSLTCQPPASPGGIDTHGNAPVQVRIGNYQVPVGFLSYYVAETAEKPIALGVILGVVLPILAIITLLSICVIRRHIKHGPSDTENYLPDVLRDDDEKKEEIALNHINRDIADDKETATFLADILSGLEDEHLKQNARQMLLPRSKLELGDLIGKGHYGCVYKAELRRADDEQPVSVAVKSLQAMKKDTKCMQSFLSEALAVKDFNHPNVMSLLGVCLTPNDNPMVVIPLVTGGDLRTYVKDNTKNLTVLELLQFAHQISEGMMYLSNLHFVHRNLAARNCLLDESKKIQLTDYGLTKDLFDKDRISSAGNSTKLLLKWMAPESLSSQEFTHKTDVWSFGIVLWELMTRGVTPYPDVEPDNIMTYLQGGSRMKKPKHCPEFVYQTMKKCWSEDSAERPIFSSLTEELRKWVQPEEEVTSNHDDSETKPLYASVDCAGSTEYLDVIG